LQTLKKERGAAEPLRLAFAFGLVTIVVTVVIVIVPIAVVMPPPPVLIPPVVMVFPAPFPRFHQFVALVRRLGTVPAVLPGRFVQVMVRTLDPFLAIVGAGAWRCPQKNQSREHHRSQSHPAEQKAS
jgi:hypothetical protein